VALVATGCGTGGLSPNKDYSTLRVFMESQPDDGTLVRVGHDKIPVYVKAEPALTEEDVSSAKLVDNPDGTYSIEVKFSSHGAIVLDMESTANRGRHMVFFCQLRPKRGSEDETELGKDLPWVSMMLIRSGISSGIVRFTPATSHEEAERIVNGINSMVSGLGRLGN